MIAELRRKLKILALLDAIIEPEWDYRYFSYNSSWSENEEIGSLRDGCGGEWFLWTSGSLAGYKCLSPEDDVVSDIDDIRNQIPPSYEDFLNEPAFSMGHATCIWVLTQSEWRKYGLPVNNLIGLESASQWRAQDYYGWATEYYERDIAISALEKVFSGAFSTSIVAELNPDITMSDLQADLDEIGIHS